MKNLKGITKMVKATAQYKALEEAMAFENQSDKERKKAEVKSFENTCLTAQAIKKIDDLYKSPKFTAELKKLEVTKITKKEFVDKVLGMSFGGYTEYIKIANSSKADQKRFLKGCEQLEAQGDKVSRSKKNYIKFLKEVGNAKAKGGEAKVQAKEEVILSIKMKEMSLDGVKYDSRNVTLTSKSLKGIKSQEDLKAFKIQIEIALNEASKMLQSASDKAPKKAPKKVAVK
tara:strand:- start:77 stop:766 length:690 start_codon:yes stop_codon:yes gene_type:complete